MACNVYSSIKRPGVSSAHIERVVTKTLATLKRQGTDVSVHTVGEARMKRLNTMFRGIDRPTDVLSFPTQDTPSEVLEGDAGDVFLCPSYIRRQAKRFGVTFKEEINRMLVHGVLHLHGFDHVTKKQAKQMFALQESILDELS